MDGLEKKHPPSPKRLRKAREEGQIPRSTKVRELLVTLIGIGIVVYGTPFALVPAKDLLDYSLARAATDPFGSIEESLQFVAVTSLLVLGLIAAVGVACGLVQTRFSFTPGVIVPRAQRLDPVKGIARVFRGAAHLHIWGGQYLASLGAIALALFWCGPKVAEVQRLTPFFLGCGMILCGAFAISTFFDVQRSRREYRQQLFMSDEELRREMREDEGDPWIRAARRGMHEELVMAELVRRIKRAKVIIVERAGTS